MLAREQKQVNYFIYVPLLWLDHFHTQHLLLKRDFVTYKLFCLIRVGPNGGARASGSSDEGIGPETRSEIHTRPGTGDQEYHQPYLPPRSSNGTPAPPTLMMSSR